MQKTWEKKKYQKEKYEIRVIGENQIEGQVKRREIATDKTKVGEVNSKINIHSIKSQNLIGKLINEYQTQRRP